MLTNIIFDTEINMDLFGARGSLVGETHDHEEINYI